MFRRITAAVSVAALLSGCSAGAGTFANTVTATASQIIAEVIKECTIGCQFVPDAEAIGNVVAAQDPLFAGAVNEASAIANWICTQITNANAANQPVAMGARVILKKSGKATHILTIGGQPLVIDGVVITGRFVGS